MKIVYDRPPLYDRITETFPLAKGRGALITFGDTIYIPGGPGLKVTRELHAHEEIHHEQQGDSMDTILSWWERYLVDVDFRLEQELPAHRAEYCAYCKRHGAGQQRFLRNTAARLSGPYYGDLISPAKAAELILTGEKYERAAAVVEGQSRG